MKRSYPDRDPGVLRPWIARDGALIRLRLVGGHLDSEGLRRVAQLAVERADGTVYLTTRANLQLRGLDHADGMLAPKVVEEIALTGLFPAPTHDLVRNIIVSPLTGRAGGRADLRSVARSLDRGLCADPDLAALPGLFWFSFDDGTGDVMHRSLDLGLVALDAERAQIRIGSTRWDAVVPLVDAPALLLEFARRFLMVRGAGRSALWHVDELPGKGLEIVEEEHARDPGTHVPSPEPPEFGPMEQVDGRYAVHVEVPDGALDPRFALALADLSPTLVVTPWRTLVVPDVDDVAAVTSVLAALGLTREEPRRGGPAAGSAQPDAAGGAAMAADQMGVEDADDLHEREHRRRADEGEPLALQGRA